MAEFFMQYAQGHKHFLKAAFIIIIIIIIISKNSHEGNLNF